MANMLRTIAMKMPNLLIVEFATMGFIRKLLLKEKLVVKTQRSPTESDHVEP